jgi:imidazoleglycerol phosphate dehydratase HisB
MRYGGDKLRRGKAEYERLAAKARVSIDLDGSGKAELSSGSAFLDHMLSALSRTGLLDLKAKVVGDGYYQHEALGNAIGLALDGALGDRSGIRRYGSACVPMDESLADVSLDLGGRSYLVFMGSFENQRIGDLEAQSIKPFLEGVAIGGRLTLHVSFYGENDHHKAESIFKALGLTLREAATLDGRGVPSTKGVI